MNRYTALLLLVGLTVMASVFPGCQSNCIDEVLFETTEMDLRVNSENLGIGPTETLNATDTIRSETRQFYNYPEFRRFSRVECTPRLRLIASAYAVDDCPEVIQYISRMDADETKFSLDTDYDASGFGLGILPAGTDLLSEATLRASVLSDFDDNVFLNGGSETPLTIGDSFFEVINDRWVTFYFEFSELDGTVFTDSVTAYVDLEF